MEFYETLPDGSLQLGDTTIPPGHGLYRKAMRDIDNKKAGLIPFDEGAHNLATDSAAERLWRDGELLIADSELNKVQDGRGYGYVSDWRDYRNALRDWPEDNKFPDSKFRPKFKSTKPQGVE